MSDENKVNQPPDGGFKQNVYQPEQQHHQHQHMTQIRFTPEENNILIECRNEAFWQRSVPLVIGSTVFLHLAMKRNIISSNMAFIKQLMVAGLSYSIGKISYLEKCKEKIRTRLTPESNLYRIMVENRRDLIPDDPNKLPSQEQSQANSAISTYDDLRRQNRSTQNQQQFQQTIDNNNNNGNITAYDELRMRNRGIQQPASKDKLNEDDILNQNTKLPSVPTPSKDFDAIKKQPSDNRKYKVNQYGDIVYTDD